MTHNELKRCPFCKGKAKIAIKSDEIGACLYKVKCSECNVTQEEYTYNKAEAVFNWNRRKQRLRSHFKRCWRNRFQF